MTTTNTNETEARQAARDSGRHPAGRRLIARATVTLATAGMLAAAPGIASARPVQDTPVECGPGYRVHGAHCVQTIVPPERGGTVGEWVLAVAGLAVLVVLS